MKHWKQLLLAAFVIGLLSVLCVFASAKTYSGDCSASGSHVTWSLNTNTGKLTISGTGAMKTLSHPWTSYSASIKSVTIRPGVTRISGLAFDGCSNLTSVTIPSSVTSISSWAFEGCSSLTNITIPEGVTDIGDFAFDGCSSLASITIPSSVTSIGAAAFCNCSSLVSITLPKGITYIYLNMFDGCSNLTSINIPEGVTGIGDYAFNNCSSLTNINIPSSVTYIHYEAFSGCNNLTSITISEGVTDIGWYAFNNCNNLTSITIPSSVTYIDSNVFEDCPNLKTVYFTGTKEQLCAIKIGRDNTCLTNATWYYNVTPAPTFADVSTSQWFAEAVTFAAQQKLVVGDGTGNFNPDAQMSLAQYMTILYRYARAAAPSVIPEKATTGANWQEAAQYINTTLMQSRYQDLSKEMTRTQMAEITATVLKQVAAATGKAPNVRATHGFADAAGNEAVTYLESIYGVDGYAQDDGTYLFKGENLIRRCEVAKVLYNIMTKSLA